MSRRNGTGRRADGARGRSPAWSLVVVVGGGSPNPRPRFVPGRLLDHSSLVVRHRHMGLSAIGDAWIEARAAAGLAAGAEASTLYELYIYRGRRAAVEAGPAQRQRAPATYYYAHGPHAVVRGPWPAPAGPPLRASRVRMEPWRRPYVLAPLRPPRMEGNDDRAHGKTSVRSAGGKSVRTRTAEAYGLLPFSPWNKEKRQYVRYASAYVRTCVVRPSGIYIYIYIYTHTAGR